MDISRKTDYALRMLSMLAEGEDCLLSVRTAAESVDVPYSFARSIQHGLVQAGIIESLRGVRGGMRLKVDPKDVTIRQIVEDYNRFFNYVFCYIKSLALYIVPCQFI